MRQDIWFDSKGAGKIHACRWVPEGQPRAVVQIIHGIAEFVERYDDFANFLNDQGVLVVAEDHMGHGKSICAAVPKGYFSGGWMAAVGDTYRLLKNTMEEFPGVPYILFGHSMGSFMARTILARYPDSGIAGAVICGSAWMPGGVVGAGKTVAGLICKTSGERNPSPFLQKMMFGGYNKRIPNPRTTKDWLSRDEEIVDRYVADPLCGFVASCGLMRDMIIGIRYVQTPANLANMKKYLPVLFIAGDADPVGPYGKGVEKAAKAFRKSGMVNVTVKLYPEARHEILNEINYREVFEDIREWLDKTVG